MKKIKVISIVSLILVLITFIILLQMNLQNKKTENSKQNKISELENKIKINENKISELENSIISEENESSTEIPDLSETDEQALEFQETESEQFEEQGLVAYEGAEKTPNIQLGEYAGLTYYSQLDSRWRSKMYSSVGNSSQTIGTSGCGPASAAMVVSSIKGNITPDQMAELYTKYGYRSANQGTYWSAFKWTADVFDIGYSECYKLDDAISKLKDNNYIIASCNQGLFTYGGHFIVLIGVEDNYIKIYDSYLYNKKFDVSSRRGKAIVNGNTVYVSIDDFRRYANYQKFFCFKNDRENNTTSNIENNISNVNSTNYQVIITANGGLNIRTGASTAYARIGGYAKGTVVTILAESNGFGKTDKGWISLNYTSKDLDINTNNSIVTNATVGQIKKLARASILYSNSNLSGNRYTYKANTTVTILQNISSNVDKIRVNVTGRVAYIDNSNYSSSIQIGSGRIGGTKKIRACTLYSNSNLTGTKYQYKANTTVIVLQYVNSYIDRIRVNQTGRIAYININNYK